jgi:ABC-type uncharacterized transport system auxiliary subunit
MRTLRLATILVVPFLLLSGCFSGPPPGEYRYYVLDYVPAASGERLLQGPWPKKLLVRNFPLGEAYLRPELVYRTSAYEIRYHWRDRWAVRPEQVVTDMVRRHVAETRLFDAVQNQYEENKPDYELKGRVLSLEEYRTESARFAHLDVRFDFVRLADNNVLWSQEFDLRRQVQGDAPVLVVRALSSLLEASVDRTIGALDSVMRTESVHP